MTKFVQGSELNATLEKIIKKAESTLVLVSPYIKLHSRVKDGLKPKKNFPELKIVIVYGKSENGNRLAKDDLEFLKEFPNIEIRYEKNLHAKYYGNESAGLITSMNLYDFSQNNNIEVGVLTETTNRIISSLSSFAGTGDLDSDAYNYFQDVILNSELLYQSIPHFESKMFGLSQTFKKASIEKDIIDQYHDVVDERFVGFKSFEKKTTFTLPIQKQFNTGFCIRTGVEIPFDIRKPYCEKAYISWAKWNNPDYSEKFCHFSGELADGDTCYAAPILRKNWREAKRLHQL